MILGVMSDTHGNALLMNQVAAVLKDRFGAAIIIHAGDNYEDGQALEWAGYSVRRVPGLSCDAYFNGAPRTFVEDFDGVTVACAHADHDLRARERAAAVVITGHTHVASLERLGRSLYLNPGHLKSSFDRGRRPSFAVVRIGETEVHASIHETDGALRAELRVSRDLIG